jgi:hypothetical protein
MCEYTSEEDRVLTHGRNITYERYAYRQLRIKEEDADKEFVPKLAGDLSSGQLAHNRFLEGKANTLIPTMPHPDDCVPVMNVIKNGNRVKFTSATDAQWFCKTCSLEFYSEAELILHRASMHHLKCWVGMFHSSVDGYVEFKEQQESEIARIKQQDERGAHGVLMSDLLPQSLLDLVENEKDNLLEAEHSDDDVLVEEPRELTPIQRFDELFAVFGDRTVAIHIFLYDNVRHQLCRLMMLPPDGTFSKIEQTHVALVVWEKGASIKSEELKKEVKSTDEDLTAAVNALELKQSGKTNNGHYKRRTHGARHSGDCSKVENKDKTFEPYEQKIRVCKKAHYASEKAYRDMETSLKSARSRLEVYEQMSEFWDILHSIEAELQKDAPDAIPKNVCVLCPKGNCAFPTARIPETLREVMSPYYSAHPNINDGEMPTTVCGSCLNMIIETTKPDSVYTVGKFVRYWATISVYCMKTGRPCDEHTSRIRMFDTLFGYGTPTSSQCQHCQLVPGNTKGCTVSGSVIAKPVRDIITKFLMSIPFDGEPMDEEDEIAMDIGRRFVNALPTITCRVCFGRLVESVNTKLVEHDAGKEDVIDIAVLKALYNACSPSDRKAIMRPIRIANDLAGSCFSTERVCVKIARFVGNADLQNLIAPSTVGCETVREMDNLSLKYFRLEKPTDRFQYNSDTKIVSFLIQNNRGPELKQHLLSVMGKQSRRGMQRRLSPARNNRSNRSPSTSSRGNSSGSRGNYSSNPNFKWDNNHVLALKTKEEKARKTRGIKEFQRAENERYLKEQEARKTREIMEFQRAENERYLKEQEAAEIESKKQKDNQPTAKPLTIAISKPSLPPMRNEERKSNPFGPEALVGALDGGSIDPDTVVTTANPEVEVRMHMMHLAQKAPVQMELIPQQHAIEHSLFLGHVFPAPGFLLTNGPDFIIREMSDFKVPGIKMLLLLVTGKPIKTGGIRIAWAGSNIQIDTTGSGMATYQIAGHAVRGFAAIHYTDLAAVCEYDSQSWCYMKNGGNLCTRTHKHQDGGDLSF